MGSLLRKLLKRCHGWDIKYIVSGGKFWKGGKGRRKELVALFISLFIYSLAHCQVGQAGLLTWILEDIHFISAFPTPVVKFIPAIFPTLQTITGTRLHILSFTDVVSMHVGTLQVISL